MYVIGVVGPFGSGCSYVAKKISELNSYEVISLSSALKEMYKNENPKKPVHRKYLQDFGNKMRQEKGAHFFAQIVYEQIKNGDNGKNYVVDSIRNPEEIEYFRKVLPEFYLFGVFAETDKRWKRVQDKYDGDKRTFDEDDRRDKGESVLYGQRVTDSFRIADIIILNNERIISGNRQENILSAKIRSYIDIIEKKIPFQPNSLETNMAMAYAASMRSSCLKRKVGAVIADASGNVFSSGYNEVPPALDMCKSEFGECYRDRLKRDYKTSLESTITKLKEREAAYSLFKKTFKILDYCRALHAEENAILNVARLGVTSDLSQSTLYTTTYPCNLCANKIAQVGIKKIVYFEPYPMEEAKKTLTVRGIEQQPFEGVTYNGYFKMMEVVY